MSLLVFFLVLVETKRLTYEELCPTQFNKANPLVCPIWLMDSLFRRKSNS